MAPSPFLLDSLEVLPGAHLAPIRLPTYDLHQHLWPPELIELLSRRAQAPYLRGDVLTTAEGSFPVELEAHELSRRLDSLDRAGIDVAVVSLQPTLGIGALPGGERDALFTAYNEGAFELAARSRGRVRVLASGRFEDGFAGLCVGASELLELSALEPTLDRLSAEDGILFVHPDRAAPQPTGAPAWWAALTEYTADMQTAFFAWAAHGIERWPSLRVVFAFLAGGAPFQLERLRSRGADVRRLAAAELYFETSSYGRQSIDLCIASFGVDRLVHGSDFPVIDPDRTLKELRGMGEAVFSAVSSTNPRALIG